MLKSRKQLNTTALIITLAMIGWFLMFKITSSDFWWHVKAGQVLRATGWIATDPFAHTREGLPYLASQSWLAQIILSVFYDLGGTGGVIFLRFLLVALTCCTLLLIDTRRIWPNAFLVLLAVILLRPFLLDRPQLWTYLCFSLQLFLTIKFIESPSLKEENRSKILISYLVPLWAVQVLWVNMHGAAALVSAALVAAVLMESFRHARRQLPILLLGFAGVLAALLLSPNGVGNFVYVQNLFADETKQFILEWQAPSPFGYLQIAGIFWILALGALLWSRKHTIAYGTILIVFGMFATTAMRHIPLFVLAAVAIVFAEMKNAPQWESTLTTLFQRRKLTVALSLGVIAALLGLNRITMSNLIRTDANSIGVVEHYASAYEFLEKVQPSGNMFNSFDVGAYFLFRGYPDRKVFVDGRNVDYGYEFLKEMAAAAQNANVWQKLEDQYGLTYAVFNYTPDQYTHTESIPYANHLNPNSDWALVYLDDRTAIYLKRVPGHNDALEQFEYHFVTPKKLNDGTVFQGITQINIHALEAELQRISRSDTHGVKALLLLGKLYYTSSLPDDALRVLGKAMERQPMHYEAYEIAGQVYEKAQQWEDAVQMYKKSMQYSSHMDASYDYERFADVWEKAGYTKKAESFRRRTSQKEKNTPY